MKRYQQLIRHDPDNGQWGDCWRTAIACILEIPPENVPHFSDKDNNFVQAMTHTQQWLKESGLGMIMFYIDINSDEPDPVRRLFEIYQNGCTIGMQDGPAFVVWGISERGIGHVVVADRNGFRHDPMHAPDDTSEILLHPICDTENDELKYMVGHIVAFDPGPAG